MDVERQDTLLQIALAQIRKDEILEGVKQNLKENHVKGSTLDTRGKEKEKVSEHWIRKGI